MLQISWNPYRPKSGVEMEAMWGIGRASLVTLHSVVTACGITNSETLWFLSCMKSFFFICTYEKCNEFTSLDQEVCIYNCLTIALLDFKFSD